MNDKITDRSAICIVSPGHAAFALTLIGFGIQGLVQRDFAAIWQPVPAGVPARAVLIFLCALVPLASGIGLFWRRAAATAARVLLAFLLLWFLLLRVPHIFVSFSVGVWYSSCQTAVIMAAAWVLYAWFAAESDRHRLGFVTAGRSARIARVLYGLALIPFGLAHFLYLQATAPLVPDWLPAHAAWAYFTGGTFIAAGLAVLTVSMHGSLPHFQRCRSVCSRCWCGSRSCCPAPTPGSGPSSSFRGRSRPAAG